MKNYIFLTNQYFPNPGATGVCVQRIAKELYNRGKEVLVVAYSDENNDQQYDNVDIKKIKIPFYSRGEFKKYPVIKRIMHLIQLFFKLIHLKDYPLRSRTLVRNYKKEIIRYVKEHNVDSCTLVATYTPLEALVAAAELKKEYPEKFQIIYYSADTLSNEQSGGGILPASTREKMGKKWEIKLFDIYDRIILMECHKDFYRQSDYTQYIDKINYVNFPLMVEHEINNISTIGKKKKRIYFTYAGTLYRVIRNPEYLCKVLTKIADSIDYEANFLGGGDCDDILKKAEENSMHKIVMRGMRSHQEALEYISMADVLLSIGNKNCPMEPSKIYEYMSTGKPIIHIYSDTNDKCLKPLQIYENALIIREGEPNAEKLIISFVLDRKNLCFSEVSKKFLSSTPGFTADLICDESKGRS